MANLLERASIVLTPTASDNGKALCVKPSDGSGDFDFSRNSAATRVNAQGLVENVQILSSNLVQNGNFSEEGAELVTNGTFDSNIDFWNKGGGNFNPLSWDNGKIKVTNDVAQLNSARQTIATEIGKTYKISADVDSTNGITPRLASSNPTTAVIGTLGTIETLTYTFTATSTSSQIELFNWQNTIDKYNLWDNVSVREVAQDWTLGTGWSIGDDVAISDGVSGNSNLNTIDIGYNVNDLVKVSFTVSNVTGGTLQVYIGITEVFTSITDGTYEFTTTATRSDGKLFVKSVNFNGSITNISVIQITTDTNLPRINYEGFSYDGSGNVVPDSGCGSWLWESQSTNLITQSEAFSDAYWSKTLMTATDNSTISPSGNVNASLIQEEIYTNSIPNIKNNSSITGLNGNNTLSFYVKNNSGRYLGVSFGSSAQRIRTNFDFDTETFKTPIFNGTTTGSVSFDKLGDYYRILIIANFPISINSEIFITPLATDTYPFYAFQNSDNRSFYIWGAQVEQGNVSSYIPTSGSQVTRNQDVCTNGGSLASINSIEGVLYAEFKVFDSDNSYKMIEINDGSSSNNRVVLYVYGSNIFGFIKSNGNTNLNVFSAETVTNFNKVAIKWGSVDTALWVNGVEINTGTASTFTQNILSDLSFLGSGTQYFFGKTKALAVWKEALSDQELTELTTI